MIDVTVRHITHKYIDENYEGGPYPKSVSESKKRNEKRKQKRTTNLNKANTYKSRARHKKLN